MVGATLNREPTAPKALDKAWQHWHNAHMANKIYVIRPYKWYGIWVFDDPAVGLTREAFVAGADDMIDLAVKTRGIENPENGFLLIFSDSEFPGYDFKLNWIQPSGTGNIYETTLEQGGEQVTQQGWLCAALGLYYPEPPKNLYVTVR